MKSQILMDLAEIIQTVSVFQSNEEIDEFMDATDELMEALMSLSDDIASELVDNPDNCQD